MHKKTSQILNKLSEFLFLILFVVICPPLFAGNSAEAEHINRGINFFSSGDFKNAISEFERALMIDPQNVEAYKWLGNSYLKIGKNQNTTFPELLEKASDAFNKALSIKPDIPEVHYNLGITYLALYKTDKAKTELDILKYLDKELADSLLSKINASRPKKVYKSLNGGKNSIQEIEIFKNQVLVPVTLAYQGETVEAILLLDTGAAVTVIHSNIATALNIDLDKTETTVGQVVGGGLLKSRHIKISSITVGPHIKEDFNVVIIEHKGSDVKFDGLLGMNFLNDLSYWVDFEQKIINWSP